MKTRIAVGAGLLLTLGSALAGTLIYGQTEVIHRDVVVRDAGLGEMSPEMLAAWRLTAESEYVSVRVPI